MTDLPPFPSHTIETLFVETDLQPRSPAIAVAPDAAPRPAHTGSR